MRSQNWVETVKLGTRHTQTPVGVAIVTPHGSRSAGSNLAAAASVDPTSCIDWCPVLTRRRCRRALPLVSYARPRCHCPIAMGGTRRIGSATLLAARYPRHGCVGNGVSRCRSYRTEAPAALHATRRCVGRSGWRSRRRHTDPGRNKAFGSGRRMDSRSSQESHPAPRCIQRNDTRTTAEELLGRRRYSCRGRSTAVAHGSNALMHPSGENALEYR